MTTKSWFYISFVDKTFIGACLIQADDEEGAIVESKKQGCNPGGEAMVVRVEEKYGDPPKEFQNVLFRSAEAIEGRLAVWLGPEGAKTETIKERRERGGHLRATFVCEDCNAGVPHTHD